MDRLQVERILGRLQDELEAVVDVPWNATHSEAFTEQLQSLQAGSQLLAAELGPDPKGPRLGLLMCAWAIDSLASSVAYGRRPPGDFTSRARETIASVAGFRARLDELDDDE